jgi:mannose/cellobiose epimerase-like protein (N-acyl-D-glucosamine 2-epimerase family)
MNKIDFTFSDLIAGYVTAFDAEKGVVQVETSDGRPYSVILAPNVYAEIFHNLGETFVGASEHMYDMLVPGRYLYAYGIFYPDGDKDMPYTFEAKHIVFAGWSENSWAFEKQDWWVKQVAQLADFYIDAEFGDGPIDYSNYRTNISAMGQKGKDGRQETDTISRLVYGFATAFLMTGVDRYLEAADAGTKYLRDHLRFQDKTEGVTFWYHAVDIREDGSERKVFASAFGDDYEAIPCYEQIYALAGPTQTYRITGDPQILADAEGTIQLFNRFFKDKSDQGGYYSHLEPVSFSAHADSLKHNKARKNWNSVGDHAPAYLVNLYLATGDKRWADFLEYTFDTIAGHFPDYDESAFVQEKFFDDWSKDQTWGWQQNRAVVGHNLKIAWNLMRMDSLKHKDAYVALAEKIAGLMPEHGMDKQRGGWYDVVDRVLQPGQKFHRYAWHDRKAWWQQEQGILAYFILSGVLGKAEYLKYARESAAFYNAWFLDTDVGGVYFNVLANGHPYALGTERGKGSHSMAGYHSTELCYLSATYSNLLVTKQPLDLWFKPAKDGFPDGKLRVSPDILPAGSIKIAEVWMDGKPYDKFDAEGLTVDLPEKRGDNKFRVRLVPSSVRFDADFMGLDAKVGVVSLDGDLSADDIHELELALDTAFAAGASAIRLDAANLKSVAAQPLRYLAFLIERRGSDFDLSVVNAKGDAAAAILESEIVQKIG